MEFQTGLPPALVGLFALYGSGQLRLPMLPAAPIYNNYTGDIAMAGTGASGEALKFYAGGLWWTIEAIEGW
ncbi:unnamed protein product [marine sediment metagenome]|uniref:Uncharacterized protein n=1 Tax=marine sediment metagenome TaxID=412755 RepID=X1GPK7_9ZZZZ